jgi:hypothetical protein
MQTNAPHDPLPLSLPFPITRRNLLASALAAVALPGCGGHGSSSGSASVRLVNATLTHPSVDLWVNGALSQSGIAQDTAGTYVDVGSSGTVLQVDDAGSSTGLAALTPSLVAGQDTALLAFESGGSVGLVTIDEAFAAPASGAATLRVADYAAQAGKLDVYVATGALADVTALASLSAVGTLTPGSTGSALSLTYTPGNYFVIVTGAGNASDVRLWNMPVTLGNQQVATVVLTPAAGGLLLNGGLLVQQGSYTAFRNDNVRVRLATAVTNNATVAATATSGASSVLIDPGSVAPQFGAYVVIPAASTLAITVDGTPVAPPAGAMEPGTDYTVLVSGAPGAAGATLIADDNRPSSDTTAAKLRLINGISGNATNLLTLTANSVSVGSQVPPDTASGYTSIPGSTNIASLVLYSNQRAGVYFSNSSFVFAAGGVFTVFATGDFSAPFLLVR